MKLDLSNPAHREALRWACDQAADRKAFAHLSVVGDAGTPEQRTALRALSDPARAAEVLWGLLEACGVDVHCHLEDDWDGECEAEIVTRGTTVHGLFWQDYEDSYDVASPTALFLALLAIPTDAPDARERALAALREAGR